MINSILNILCDCLGVIMLCIILYFVAVCKEQDKIIKQLRKSIKELNKKDKCKHLS